MTQLATPAVKYTGEAARTETETAPWTPTPRQRSAVAKTLRGARDEIVSAWHRSQFDASFLDRYGVAGAAELSPDAAIRSFIDPLFRLLVEYAATGEARFREVYLDERLRYAPHLAEPEVRRAFFSELLAEDERAVLASTRASASQHAALRALLGEIHAPLLASLAGAKTIRLVAVGDCLMADIRSFLTARARAADIHLDVRTLYFSTVADRSLSTDSVMRFIEQNPTDLIALSFLTFSALPLYPALLRAADRSDRAECEASMAGLLSVMQRSLEHLRQHTDAPFLLHNASGLPLTPWRERLPMPPIASGRRRMLAELNARIGELAGSIRNTIVIDEARVAREKGVRECARTALPASITRHAFFHTNRLGEHLAPEYDDVVRSFAQLRRAKVLVVDLDNTLWNGVMAEGPVTHFVERQKLLKQLKNAGMLLAVASKNDPASIRWNELSLSPEDFVLLKINWGLKVESVRQAAQELDLGLDSFVFIDDNPVERDLMTRELPKVRTLDATDPTTWRWVERLLVFPNTRDTDEARTRTELYKQQVSRREEMSKGFDYGAMMHSLGLEVEFGRARASDLARLAELVQRTNQFNTTTIRYTREQLSSLLKRDDHRVYVGSLRDKFGDLGLVASAIVRDGPGERIIESFVMSCRAMGFQLELLVLRLVLTTEGRTQPVVGRFVPTDRNAPAAELFSSQHFLSRGPTEWVLATDAMLPEAPDWFSIEQRR